MKPELRFKVELKFQRRVLGNLHTATEGIDRALFRQTDDDRLRSRVGGVLMLDQSTGNLLQDRVVFGGVATQQLTELLGTKIQLILLQDWIVGSSFSKLLVVQHGAVAGVVVEVQTLTTRIETDDRLLRLQVFQLDTRIFVRSSVKRILVGDTVERPASFGLLTSLKQLIGLLEQLAQPACAWTWRLPLALER